MDNQNNQTSSNNLSDPNGFGAPSAPLADSNTAPPLSNFPSPPPSENPSNLSSVPGWTPTPQSIPAAAEPAVSSTPTFNQDPNNTWPSFPPTNITASTPQSTFAALSPQNTNPAFTPPVSLPPQPEPANPLPAAPDWSSVPQQPTSSGIPQPIPTFSPPQATSVAANTTPQPTLSPLDNPWGAPTQPPAIDGSSSPVQPSWMSMPQNPTPESVPPASTESAPTDLSHLINNGSSQPAIQTVPDALVIPTPATPEVSASPAEVHKGIPKWLIGIGVGLLIFVVAVSAYFILGIGQPTKTTTSLPATIAAQNTEPKPATPTTAPVVQPTAQPNTTNSDTNASFGQLQGEESSTATSAADLLRQRQQQAR